MPQNLNREHGSAILNRMELDVLDLIVSGVKLSCILDELEINAMEFENHIENIKYKFKNNNMTNIIKNYNEIRNHTFRNISIIKYDNGNISPNIAENLRGDKGRFVVLKFNTILLGLISYVTGFASASIIVFSAWLLF